MHLVFTTAATTTDVYSTCHALETIQKNKLTLLTITRDVCQSLHNIVCYLFRSLRHVTNIL